MAYQFKLPDIGEGMTEGQITQWYVKPGDEIKEDDNLVQIENDKSVEDITSPVTGKISKILVDEDSTATVGQPLVEIATADQPADDSAGDTTPEKAADKQDTANATAYQFKLPDIGEGMTEGQITQWYVKPGDEIKEDDNLVQIENDKSVEDITSPVTGKINKILVDEDSTATVGQPLVEIMTTDKVAAEDTADNESTSAPESQPEQPTTPTETTTTDHFPVLAMPSVRKYARDQQIDLGNVKGTGRHGQITKSDVDQALKGGSQPAPATSTTSAPTADKPAPLPAGISDQETREKMTPMRKAIAKSMINSKHTIPHVTLFDDVEVSKLVAHRKKFKDAAAKQDIKLTFLPYVVKALVIVLREFPIFNASLDNETQEIVYRHYFNVGIATNTDHGLYVPVLKQAETKSIFTLAKEIAENAQKAADSKLKASEMNHGSISITNIGSMRGGWFTPVINYPESAILGVGFIKKEPYVNADEQIVVGRMLKLSLSFDHRLIDGATAQEAMNRLKGLLQDPELLLMEG
uniref:Dihydrolipoamide acetyltransferase component of pyruvate dehydrogenase complex n=1 Tax=Loigolactobacillus rennini TaxID=238013 RepID=A0A1K2I508_9LACO|nr:Dihydrolipoamide acetyltransferase component of pyruvate dehydrogenase complex [Loigolactobacillus rennini]